MSDAKPPIPPVEPTPPVAAAPVTPPPAPPYVDPYAQVTPPVPPAYPPTGYAPGTYPPGYYGAPQPPKGLSIASLVTGIGSIVFSVYGFGILPSIAAIITGNLARKRQPYARGFWLAGLICGYIGLGFAVLWIIGIILFIVFVVSNPDVQSGSYSSS